MATDAAITRNLCRLHFAGDEFLNVLYPGAKCGCEPPSDSKHHPELEPCSCTQSVVLVKLSTGAIGTPKPEQCTPTYPTKCSSCRQYPKPKGQHINQGVTPPLSGTSFLRLSFDFHAATYISYNSVKKGNSHKALQPYGNKLRAPEW